MDTSCSEKRKLQVSLFESEHECLTLMPGLQQRLGNDSS